MTEDEWLICCDSRLMLQFLEGKPTVRKLRLAGCAWWRRAYDHLAADELKRIINVAEQVAEGGASQKRLRKVLKYIDFAAVADASRYTVGEDTASGWWSARCVAGLCAEEPSSWASAVVWGASLLNDADRAAIIHDVFGNPYRPIAIKPSWRWWHDGTIVNIAAAIYDERSYRMLPILADALEDAGCDNGDILSHLRGSGPHVRGCWALDLILGKE